MARLLVVHHSPTPPVRSLTEAVLAGAGDDAITGVEVVEREALAATAEDVLAADGYLLGTTANFGYMSGALKHFFDTIFLEAGGALTDDGSASGGTGGRGRSGCGCTAATTRPARCGRCSRSSGRCRWQQSAPVLEVLGEVGDAEREAAYELGGTIAALLSD